MGSVVGGFTLFLIGWLGGWLHHYTKPKIVIEMTGVPTGLSWERLPSGWSRDMGPLTAYAMTQGGAAYWWISRRGRTVIEGPADSLEMAKLEAEREARELSP